MNVTKQYFRYVSQNIFGLIGTSCYILAEPRPIMEPNAKIKL